MRQQRSGLVIAITSTGGIAGQEFCSAYSASKFGLEGWMESLAPEVAAFGIRAMVVEPGFFRTDLLTPESTTDEVAAIDGLDTGKRGGPEPDAITLESSGRDIPEA